MLSDRIHRNSHLRTIATIGAMAALWFSINGTVFAQSDSRRGGEFVSPPSRFESQTQKATPIAQPAAPLESSLEQFVSGPQLGSSVKFMIGATVLSIAPSILIMTTCFVRFVIVLGLLKQALGTNNLPPNQVIVSLCLFLTLLVMGPVWKQAYEDGIGPYTEQPGTLTANEAFTRTAAPLRKFMSDQIEGVGNSDTVWMLLDYQQRASGNVSENASSSNSSGPPVETYDEVPLTVLLPAYMLSEIKTAFVIGFQIYLPFLVIDMVVSSVLVSMGMVMLPPVMVSLPFKLLLFVLIDGWFLTVGMLLQSVAPFG